MWRHVHGVYLTFMTLPCFQPSLCVSITINLTKNWYRNRFVSAAATHASIVSMKVKASKVKWREVRQKFVSGMIETIKIVWNQEKRLKRVKLQLQSWNHEWYGKKHKNIGS